MCGSESGMVWGGLIVAGAMLVWAFAGDGHAAARDHRAPVAHREAPALNQTTLTVSSDGLALSFEDLTIRLSL